MQMKMTNMNNMTNTTKKTVLKFFLLTTFFISLAAQAEEVLYVQVVNAKLKTEPKLAAQDVATLGRGDEVKVLNTHGPWYEVQFKESKGWISKLFVNKTKPIGQADLLANPADSEAKTSRKRSANYAVSAATRGLTASDRVRDGKELFRSDKKAVEDLEKLEVPEGQVENFQKSGNLLGK